jgi:hypothetical protein
MRLPQFRILTAMVVVAATALVMGLGLRASCFRERSRFHQERAGHYHLLFFLSSHRCATGDFQQGLLKVVDGSDGFSEVRPASPSAELILQERVKKMAERQWAYESLRAYHSRRAGEFERAAWLPWISVPDDHPLSEPE